MIKKITLLTCKTLTGLLWETRNVMKTNSFRLSPADLGEYQKSNVLKDADFNIVFHQIRRKITELQMGNKLKNLKVFAQN